MAQVEREDGVRLHWAARGSGPAVVIIPWWNGYPEVYDGFMDLLASEHRVVHYDARGTGRSTRSGPHDMDTSAADLEALLELAGGSAVAVATADGSNFAVRVAAARPDLVAHVVSVGTAPFGRGALEGADAMAGSSAVLRTLLGQMESYYASALRTIVATGNEQMSEDEVRERVERQLEYCPQDTGVPRLRAWIDDEPDEYARAVGDRLMVVTSPGVAGTWFPHGEQFAGIVRERLPEAQLESVEDGMVSRPDLTAALVRRLTVPVRS